MSAKSPPILVDGHVHFHDCFDPSTFFESAYANFESGARARGLDCAPVGCLMFAESAGRHDFRRFRERPETFSLTGWRLECTGEETSVIARGSRGRTLILFAGRQLVMRGRLEMLALATTQSLPEGDEIEETLAAVLDAGALAVLPWGFGKWWLGRGERVRRVLLAAPPLEIFLGDNGGRPRSLPEPQLFTVARARGIAILPGSDPFPMRGHNRRAGSYGFCLEGELSEAYPTGDLTTLIRANASSVRSFGMRRGTGGFFRDQLAMQAMRFAVSANG